MKLAEFAITATCTNTKFAMEIAPCASGMASRAKRIAPFDFASIANQHNGSELFGGYSGTRHLDGHAFSAVLAWQLELHVGMCRDITTANRDSGIVAPYHENNQSAQEKPYRFHSILLLRSTHRRTIRFQKRQSRTVLAPLQAIFRAYPHAKAQLHLMSQSGIS